MVGEQCKVAYLRKTGTLIRVVEFGSKESAILGRIVSVDLIKERQNLLFNVLVAGCIQ